MRVVVANVKCNPQMRQSSVDHDMAQIAKLTADSNTQTFFFGSEIEIPRYDKSWDDHMTAVGAMTVNQESECPISYEDEMFRLIDAEVYELHGGKDGVSPHRDNSIAVFEKHFRNRPDTPYGDPWLDMIAKHTVSGVEGTKYPDTKAWRIDHWNIDHVKTTERVAIGHNAGRNVVVGGDLNKRKPAPYHPKQVEVHKSGYMHLYAIPADGYEVVVQRVDEIPIEELFTDHAVIWADFYFRKI